jgi:hypothetical protein
MTCSWKVFSSAGSTGEAGADAIHKTAKVGGDYAAQGDEQDERHNSEDERVFNYLSPVLFISEGACGIDKIPNPDRNGHGPQIAYLTL